VVHSTHYKTHENLIFASQFPCPVSAFGRSVGWVEE
jgi:predicted DNA-binding transcriptional regulator AlpA